MPIVMMVFFAFKEKNSKMSAGVSAFIPGFLIMFFVLAFLKMHKKKIFGLTIDAERLVDIRDGRMANTKYSSARQCRMEIREVEKLYKQEKIPFLNTTKLSVEEITAKILSETGLQRYKY